MALLKSGTCFITGEVNEKYQSQIQRPLEHKEAAQSLMLVINAFEQGIVAESYTLPRRKLTPFCPHSLNIFQVSSYQN